MKAILKLMCVLLCLCGFAVHAEEYVIQNGDTLTKISKKFGVELQTITADNQGKVRNNGNLIFAGDTLNIRSKVAAAPAVIPDSAAAVDPVKAAEDCAARLNTKTPCRMDTANASSVAEVKSAAHKQPKTVMPQTSTNVQVRACKVITCKIHSALTSRFPDNVATALTKMVTADNGSDMSIQEGQVISAALIDGTLRHSIIATKENGLVGRARSYKIVDGSTNHMVILPLGERPQHMTELPAIAVPLPAPIAQVDPTPPEATLPSQAQTAEAEKEAPELTAIKQLLLKHMPDASDVTPLALILYQYRTGAISPEQVAAMPVSIQRVLDFFTEKPEGEPREISSTQVVVTQTTTQ